MNSLDFLFSSLGMNPDRTYPAWYKNVVSLWILFGMAWLALIINLCISLLEKSRDLCRCCKRKNRGVEQELIDGNQHVSLGPEDEQSCSVKAAKPVGPEWIAYTFCCLFFLVKGFYYLANLNRALCFGTSRSVTTWENPSTGDWTLRPWWKSNCVALHVRFFFLHENELLWKRNK